MGAERVGPDYLLPAYYRLLLPIASRRRDTLLMTYLILTTLYSPPTTYLLVTTHQSLLITCRRWAQSECGQVPTSHSPPSEGKIERSMACVWLTPETNAAKEEAWGN